MRSVVAWAELPAPVEQANAQHNVGELVQLRGLVLGSQGGEGLESNAWEHRLQRGCDFTLCGSLLPGLVARTHNQKVECTWSIPSSIRCFQQAPLPLCALLSVRSQHS